MILRTGCWKTGQNAAGPKTARRSKAESLSIWENLLKELLPYIRKNKQGQDTFPTSTYFSSKQGNIATAINQNGGFPAVIRHLQEKDEDGKAHLAKDYVPVSDDKLTPAKGQSRAKSMRDWENFAPAMAEVCKKLGRFPKTCVEIEKCGRPDVANAVSGHFGLDYIGRVMREKGLLDFLDEQKGGG